MDSGNLHKRLNFEELSPAWLGTREYRDEGYIHEISSPYIYGLLYYEEKYAVTVDILSELEIRGTVYNRKIT